MLALGIVKSHEPAACIVDDQKGIIAWVAEERFAGLKHPMYLFPERSIRYCLTVAGLKSINEVDKICFTYHPKERAVAATRQYLRNFKPIQLFSDVPFTFYENKTKDVKLLRNLFNLDTRNGPKIEFFNHHSCHAASTYYCSGFKKSKIITIDSRGDTNNGMFAIGTDMQIEKINEIKPEYSIGTVYSLVTEILGFDRNGDAGKTMGLAPYGKNYLPIFDKILQIKDGNVKVDLKPLNGLPRRLWHEPLTDAHKDLAYSVQKRLEQVEVEILEYLNKYDDTRNLCLAGGVALNCVSNGVLLQHDSVDNIYVQAASSDEGVALGAALLGLNMRVKMDHAYFGPEYDNAKIKSLLDNAGVYYYESSEPEKIAAEALAKDKIVGWFQGRMEVGPRALGNRSILANPSKAEMKDAVNLRVKHRENWRPLCPSFLAERAGEFGINHESPFMVLSFDIAPEKRGDIAAVVHVDGSARPQTVTPEQNRKYYDLIKHFDKQTGIPVLMNTSLNIQGQPIIENPKQAIAFFYSEGADMMVLGNYVLEKARK